MKKITFVIGVLSDGGAERVISVLAKEMVNIGYDINIVTIYGDKNDYINDDKVNVNPIAHKFNNKFMKKIEILFKLRSFFKKEKPDIIISFVAIVNIYTILSKFLLKSKLIVSERNDPYQNPENKYIRKLRDILYKYTDAVVFQTNDAKDYFSRNIQEKGIVIPNPLTSNLPYWNKNQTEKKIITASRLVPQKNIPMLIDAFVKLKKDYPGYTLKIFGIGKLQEELQKYINNLGLDKQIILSGFSNNIHYEMSTAELFVISSNYEGISNSMLEALAIGVPVISTDSPIGGARMFINSGKNGYLTRVGETEELYHAMKTIISDKNLANEISKNAMKIRDELSAEKIICEWLIIIKKVNGC